MTNPLLTLSEALAGFGPGMAIDYYYNDKVLWSLKHRLAVVDMGPYIEDFSGEIISSVNLLPRTFVEPCWVLRKLEE